MGLIAAVRRGSATDQSLMVASFIGVSAPQFVVGLLLLYVFAVRLGWFPIGGYGTWRHLVLPSLTLGLLGAGWYARMMRSSMIDVLRQDYIRTARAKGLGGRAILLRHALPNAILPVIAMIGIDIGLFMGGIVVVESVFGWPGIGQLAWQAIQRVDIPDHHGRHHRLGLRHHPRQPAGRYRRAIYRPAHQAALSIRTNRKGNTEMKRYLASTVAASALALMMAMPLAAQEKLDPNAKQGGEIIITYKDDVATLDPAIGYDWQNWSMIKSLYDGLMDYEPGTTNLKPDLAEGYEISPDGQTFMFKLRKGVKFHNGREMTADDVKYSLDRVVNPKTQSPGAGFFASIKGHEEVAGGKSESLSGVTVVDPSTIKIELSRPDATFLHVMAINFAHVVPKEAVEQYGADFGKNPVGTGAYKMAEWTLGQRLVFERNPDYWQKGLPYLNKITFEIGQEPIVALLRLQKGEIDVPGDGIPPAKFQEVMNDPEQKARVVVGGPVAHRLCHHEYDHGALRQREGTPGGQHGDQQGPHRPTDQQPRGAGNQPLPPSMPGYDTAYKGYAYDVDKAKALLAEAGHADGFETELFAMNTDPNPRIAQAIQQDLAAIGIKANIQALAQANVIAAGGDKAGAPMIWSGGMAWIADFPDPSNFYGPILGCGGAVPGGWNWAWYCNADLDKKAAEADAIVDPAKAVTAPNCGQRSTARSWKMRHGRRCSTNSASPCSSPRMGGADDLYVDPVHIPINYDHVYVNDVQ